MFRLFHQALNDALLPGGENTLATAFIAYGRDLGWDRAPVYLLRSLPGHAARAGLADDLLADDEYILHADLQRLIQAVARASSADGRRTRLLRMTPEAITASPPERAALFSVTEVLENLGDTYRGGWRTPYRALCAQRSHDTSAGAHCLHRPPGCSSCGVRGDGGR